MDLIQLTSDYEMKPFDCGDAALNGFLFNRICNSIVLRIRIYNPIIRLFRIIAD